MRDSRTRQADLRLRRRAAGWLQVTVWLHRDHLHDFQSFIQRLGKPPGRGVTSISASQPATPLKPITSLSDQRRTP